MKNKHSFSLLFGVVCLMLVLVTLPLLGACTPKATSGPVVIRFNSGGAPEGHVLSQLSHYFGEQVTEKTEGRVKFEYYYGGALGMFPDQIDNIKSGKFDFGPWVGALGPAKTPLQTFQSSALIFDTDVTVRQKMNMELFELPAMKDELAAWDAIFIPWAPIGGDIPMVYTKDKPVNKLDDLKGLRLTLGSKSDALEAVGALPVVIGPTEWYDAIAKGTADGGVFPMPTMDGYKLYEVLDYCFTLRTNIAHPFMIMKLSTFNSLSSKDQKIIMDVASTGVMWPKIAADEEMFVEKVLATYADAGLEMIECSPGEQQKWNEQYLKKQRDTWIKDMEDKGLPGQLVMDTWDSLGSKYSK